MKKRKYIYIILMSFFTTCTFCLNLKMVNTENLKGITNLARYLENLEWAFNGYNIAYSIIFIGIFMIYKKIYFDGSPINKSSVVLSIFFSLSMVFGYSYASIKSWDLIFGGEIQFLKALMVGLGYYFMFYIAIKKLYLMIDKYKEKKQQSKIANFIFEKHPFILPFIIILIVWLPYLITFYPGTTAGSDTAFEIYNTYHIKNYNSNSVNLISEDVYINKHHPVIHQVMLYGFMKFGEVFHDYNIGMFCYTFMQYILTIVFLSYTFIWMRKHKTPMIIRKIALLVYLFLSFIPLFAINAGKETYSSIFTILFALKIYDFIKDEKEIVKRKNIILIMIYMLFMMLFRNDGIYRVIISIAFLLIFMKKYRKQIVLILLVPLLIYQGYDKILLPSLKISDGNIREVLSIPFQQTARLANVKGLDVYSLEDQKTIGKVLKVKTLAKDYDPNLSDPIKNKSNTKVSKRELINYFKVWLKYFFKYPTIYVEATLNNTYQYFYPNQSKNIGYMEIKRLSDDGIFNIKFNEKTENARQIIEYMHRMVKKIPAIGMLYSVGFHVWVLLIAVGYIFYKKQYKFLTALIPCVSVLLICLASPVNGHWRYTLPIIMSFPITIAMIFNLPKKDSNKE